MRRGLGAAHKAILAVRRTRRQSGGPDVCCAQRFIVRIIFMVPLYSLLSFLSLLMDQNSVYFATFRDWCARARRSLLQPGCAGCRLHSL